MSEWTIIGWLLKFVKPLRGKMILAILLGIISNLSVIMIFFNRYIWHYRGNFTAAAESV